MKTSVVCMCLALAASAWGGTISVPAGETMKVEPGRVFAGDVLVKTGEGTLDLTGARLKNAGLEIREGAVKFAGGGETAVTARYVKWNVTKARPAKSGAPEHGNSGSQFAEFRLFRGGKMLTMPKNATAVNARPGWAEGPQMGIDGNLKTKCYHSPFIADFGEEMTFDGYSFATANDAIGRDPYSWAIDAGFPQGSQINWVRIGSVDKFEAPKERFAEAGKIFPVALCDVVPVNYPVTVCGRGRLVLSAVTETLENVNGNGLICLEGSSVVIGSSAGFAGTVAGDGSVVYGKK